MSEKNPERLDQLFQKGSEHYDFEYNPEAWQQMESLLDKDKRRRRILWWWRAGILFLLLAFGIGIFMINGVRSDAEQSWSEENQRTDRPPESELSEKSSLENQAFSEPSESDPVIRESDNENSSKQELEAKQDILLKKSGLQKEEIISDSPETKLGKPTPPVVILEHENLEEPPLLDQRPRTAKSEQPTATTTSDSTRLSGDYPPRHAIEMPTIPVLPFRMLSYPTEPFIPPLFPTEPLGEDQIIAQAQAQNFLLLGIQGSAEATFVDTKHPTGIDWKGGIQLEYFYQGRFSISLGANYVQKSYTAGAKGYNPPTGFWTRKIAPESTDGQCKILEIPLLIGYYPKGILGSGFFAKMGISSFFMLKERYYFSYYQSDQDLIRKWYGNNEYQHWFGIGQVSMGYNWGLGTRTSIQLAPYFQAPLTGLGHGKVKLWSLGINANLNFRVN